MAALDLKAQLDGWGQAGDIVKRKRGGKKHRERELERRAAAPPATAADYLQEKARVQSEGNSSAPVTAPAAAPAAAAAHDAWASEPIKRKRGGKKQRERDETFAAAEAAAKRPRPSEAVAAAVAEAPAEAAKPKKKGPCEHFARGQCTRGDKCRFSHAAGASSEGTKKRARPGAQARHKAQDWAANNGKREPDRGDNVRDVECRGHALPCVRRVVEKAGAKNYGRAFLSCRYWRDKGGCGHFAWVDDGGTSVR